jgi:uncharacterized protein (TIGR02231 family)
MKRAVSCITLLLVIISFGSARGADGGGPPASRVTSVVVYPGGATVERTALVAPGMDHLAITDLPASFDAPSVRVEADPGIELGEVTVQDVGTVQPSGAREADLTAKITALQDQKATLDVDARSAELVRDFLARLGGAGEAPGGKVPAYATDAKAAEALAETISRLGHNAFGRMQQVEVEKRSLDRQIEALQRDLKRAQSGTRDTRAITVSLAVSRAGSVHLSYRVNGAGWAPGYAAALDSSSSVASIERRASVFQKTGEDWTGVKLTLSTAQPRMSPQGAEPVPWRLAVVSPPPEAAAKASAAVPMLAAMAPSAPVEQRFAVTETQTTFATQFDVPGRSDIPADGRRVTVLLSKQSLPVTQTLRVVPRAEQAAMLTVAAERPEGVWVPGQLQLYRDGSLVGSTQWDPMKGSKLTLPFGRDELVRVVANRVKDRSAEAGFLGNRVQQAVAYDYEITNLHKIPVALLILDATPVSASDQIEVTSTFDPKPTLENWEHKQGVVGWERTLGAGATLKVAVEHLIRHAKDVQVEGLAPAGAE